jgi:hypothetical protein
MRAIRLKSAPRSSRGSQPYTRLHPRCNLGCKQRHSTTPPQQDPPAAPQAQPRTCDNPLCASPHRLRAGRQVDPHRPTARPTARLWRIRADPSPDRAGGRRRRGRRDSATKLSRVEHSQSTVQPVMTERDAWGGHNVLFPRLLPAASRARFRWITGSGQVVGRSGTIWTPDWEWDSDARDDTLRFPAPRGAPRLALLPSSCGRIAARRQAGVRAHARIMSASGATCASGGGQTDGSDRSPGAMRAMFRDARPACSSASRRERARRIVAISFAIEHGGIGGHAGRGLRAYARGRRARICIERIVAEMRFSSTAGVAPDRRSRSGFDRRAVSRRG